MNNIIQILGDVVTAINVEIGTDLQAIELNGQNRGITGVRYIYGPYKEIESQLMDLSKSDTFDPTKYPIIALIQPFNEVSGAEIGYRAVDSLDIAICMSSKPDADTPMRYAVNFYPVLYPIYQSLLRQLFYNNKTDIVSEDLIQHTKIDWPFWDAGTGKNPFNDVLDVVELKNLKLKIKLENC